MNSIRRKVIAAVAPVFRVGAGQLVGPRRSRPLVMARWTCWSILRAEAKLSLPQIGALFAVDHTSVAHGINSLEDIVERDPELSGAVARALAAYRGEARIDRAVICVPWSRQEHDRLMDLAGRNVSPADIAVDLGRTEAAVRERLRAHRAAAGRVDRRTVKASAAPPQDAGRPFTDNLWRCDARWKEALEGRQYESLNIPQRPMIWLEPPTSAFA